MSETVNVNLKVNGAPVSVPKGSTILEAARSAGIKIPTLCYLKDINAIGACRVCVVEVKGARSLVASCVYPVNEGMEVMTATPKVIESRKTTVELMLSDHNKNCLSCVRSTNCELQSLAEELGCDTRKYAGETKVYPIDDKHPSIVRDNSKCILCRRCVAACRNYQSVSVIGANARGFDTHIGCLFEKGLNDVACVGCGQCINVCPTGALTEKSEIENVLKAMNDPSKVVIVGTEPSVRITLGEEFGMPIGTNVEGKMAAALRRLGFKHVFDVDFGADLTIMEEGFEFINRLQSGGVLPMITSCSPGWVKFIEHNYPELLPNLSTCKSPQQMFGAVAKTYYAEKLGVDPKDMYVATIMPCTAKKYEKGRPYQSAAGEGIWDIDAVLTTRELARLIRRHGIMFEDLPEEQFDTPFGIGSGAGLIFGSSGGVMEAALRTVAETLDKKPLSKLDFKQVRGMEGLKEASYKIAGATVKVAVVSGLKNARELLARIKANKADYHFIEIMACPGGCINGGGQPIKSAEVRNFTDYKAKRMKTVYASDKAMTLRKSHENPAIKQLYKEFLGAPNGHKAHDILHTKYIARGKH